MSKQHLFKPGVSGNPGGRPAIFQEVKDHARSYTIEAIDGLVGIARNKKAPAQARVAAWNAILDRSVGKPVPTLDADGGGALVVQIVKFAQSDDQTSE